jgi:hypothetical protein
MSAAPTPSGITADRDAFRAQWTPGPWRVGDQNGHCGISIDEISEEGARVATVYLGVVTTAVEWGEQHFALPENAEAVANARLIAAAPELVEALRRLLNFAENTESELGIELDSARNARALLARIEGESA